MNKKRWDTVYASAVAGDFLAIPRDMYMRYYGTIKRIHTDEGTTCDNLPHQKEFRNFWYWGIAGSGKSHSARAFSDVYYLKSAANKWWDGYRQGFHDTVIIEDFDKKHDYQGHNLKIWCDRYSFPAEVKGGTIRIRPKYIIITSNYSMNDIWQDDSTLEPLNRRIQDKQFKTKYVDPEVVTSESVADSDVRMHSAVPGFRLPAPIV